MLNYFNLFYPYLYTKLTILLYEKRNHYIYVYDHVCPCVYVYIRIRNNLIVRNININVKINININKYLDKMIKDKLTVKYEGWIIDCDFFVSFKSTWGA